MIKAIIETCARQRGLALILVLAFVVAGVLSAQRVNVDAIPDLSDTQVIVYSSWNVSPDIIEDQVTYPIVTSLLAVPKVKDIRGLSMFGASYVYVIFEDGTDLYWARSRVLEYLSGLIPKLPEGVQTQLGPDATGVGWVYQYAIKDTSGKQSLDELRSLQDWFLRYQIQSVPGVSEVASFGGFEKQYQVQVNPEYLRAYKISLQEVARAIRGGNEEHGARIIEFSGIEYMVRLRGYAQSRQDLENIVIASDSRGTPIYVKNVARVEEGPEIRRGVGDLNGLGDTVGGIVVMRHGENAQRVIERVKDKLEDLKSGLPEGVELVTTYDRSQLIDRSIDTLKSKTILEMVVVAAVIAFFLLHFSSAMVPILVLPTAVMISFIPMLFMGISANIMSLGGIIISIGAMVDAAIVVVENCQKHLETWKEGDGGLDKIVLKAVLEVAPASFYSLLVIAVAFLPIFALEAQEGKLFQPLAFTKTAAMLIAAVLSITMVPALMVLLSQVKRGAGSKKNSFLNWLLAPKGFPENRHPVSRWLIKVYGPIVDKVVDHRRKVIVGAILAVVVTVPVFFRLGGEFMPPLNEGTILYMPTTMPGISVGEAYTLLQKQDEILKSFPEVASVHGKAGKAKTATDPAPLSMMETVVVLKEPGEWPIVDRWYSSLPEFTWGLFSWLTPSHRTWDELIREMDKKMQFPGVTNAWTMPIKGRIDMLTTGIRTPVGIKVSGPDMNKIASLGQEIEKILPQLKGTRSVFAERVTGGYFLDINFNREGLARHGISVRKAHTDVRSAMAGIQASTTVEGQERYGVQVRYARGFRQDLEDLKQILLASPKGYQVPLGSVASLQFNSGPGMIRNENGLLTGYVFVDLHSSDVSGYVREAKKLIAEQLKLPAGYSLSWSGQFESIVRVQDKLKVMLPLTLAIIILLIFLNTRSAVKTGIVLLAIPFSAIGAIWLLYGLDYNMSVAVWVGLIALLGVDAETAIYMLMYLDLSYDKRVKEGRLNSFADLRGAIHEGAVHRIRPKMMTVMTTFFGLLPVLLASTDATGADVMKRMVAPMIGGIFSSFLLELVVYPAIYAVWRERKLKHQ